MLGSYPRTHDGDFWYRFLTAIPALGDAGLTCRGAGCEVGFRPPMPVRRIPTFSLNFVTAGRFVYSDQNRREEVEVHAPAVFWLFPGVAHSYAPGPRGWVSNWLLFEGGAAQTYEEQGAWDRDHPVLPASPRLADAIAPEFARLRVALESNDRHAAWLASSITHGLIGLAATLTGLVTRDRTPGAVQAIVDGAALPHSVAERARELGMTAAELRRTVLDATGLTVHDLVIRARLATAQDLLDETDLEIATIAARVGYDDPSYFTRLFSRRLGMSPSDFRSRFGRRGHEGATVVDALARFRGARSG